MGGRWSAPAGRRRCSSGPPTRRTGCSSARAAPATGEAFSGVPSRDEPDSARELLTGTRARRTSWRADFEAAPAGSAELPGARRRACLASARGRRRRGGRRLLFFRGNRAEGRSGIADSDPSSGHAAAGPRPRAQGGAPDGRHAPGDRAAHRAVRPLQGVRIHDRVGGVESHHRPEGGRLRGRRGRLAVAARRGRRVRRARGRPRSTRTTRSRRRPTPSAPPSSGTSSRTHRPFVGTTFPPETPDRHREPGLLRSAPSSRSR